MTSHPDIRTGAAARLKARARKTAGPLVAAINERSGAVPRSQVDALRAEIEQLREELEHTTRALTADVALLRAQLDAPT